MVIPLLCMQKGTKCPLVFDIGVSPASLIMNSQSRMKYSSGAWSGWSKGDALQHTLIVCHG